MDADLKHYQEQPSFGGWLQPGPALSRKVIIPLDILTGTISYATSRKRKAQASAGRTPHSKLPLPTAAWPAPCMLSRPSATRHLVGDLRVPSCTLSRHSAAAQNSLDSASLINRPLPPGGRAQPAERDLQVALQHISRPGVTTTSGGRIMLVAAPGLHRGRGHHGAPSSWPRLGGQLRLQLVDLVRDQVGSAASLKHSTSWPGCRRPGTIPEDHALEHHRAGRVKAVDHRGSRAAGCAASHLAGRRLSLARGRGSASPVPMPGYRYRTTTTGHAA
jgi:hypothetical protein